MYVNTHDIHEMCMYTHDIHDIPAHAYSACVCMSVDTCRANGCTVESKYKHVVLLNKEMIFEHGDGTLDTYL